MLVASQPGDSQDAASTNVTRTVVVNAAPTAITLTQVATSPGIGTNITFQVRVAAVSLYRTR